MSTIIHIEIGPHRLEAEIYDTPTGRAILKALPLHTQIITWGMRSIFG